MTTTTTIDRYIKIRNMLAAVARHPLLPADFKDGIAAMAEELVELRRAVCGRGCGCVGHGTCPLR